MNKFLLLSGIFCCISAHAAAPKGVTADFWQQKQAISAEQTAVYAKLDGLSEIRLEKGLNAAETKTYNKLVCDAVATERKFAKLMSSDIAQAKIVLEDANLDAAAIQDMMESSENYEAAQEWVGTPNECKS